MCTQPFRNIHTRKEERFALEFATWKYGMFVCADTHLILLSYSNGQMRGGAYWDLRGEHRDPPPKG